MNENNLSIKQASQLLEETNLGLFQGINTINIVFAIAFIIILLYLYLDYQIFKTELKNYDKKINELRKALDKLEKNSK